MYVYDLCCHKCPHTPCTLIFRMFLSSSTICNPFFKVWGPKRKTPKRKIQLFIATYRKFSCREKISEGHKNRLFESGEGVQGCPQATASYIQAYAGECRFSFHNAVLLFSRGAQRLSQWLEGTKPSGLLYKGQDSILRHTESKPYAQHLNSYTYDGDVCKEPLPTKLLCLRHSFHSQTPPPRKQRTSFSILAFQMGYKI